MKHFFNILFIAAFCILSACVKAPTEHNFNNKIVALQGRPINVISESWGEPHKHHIHKDGSITYAWVHIMSEEWDFTPAYPFNAIRSFRNRPPFANHADVPFFPGTNYNQVWGGPWSVNRPLRLTHYCAIFIKTNSEGIIQNHRTQGDNCLA